MILNLSNIYVKFPFCTMHKKHILISFLLSSKESFFWHFEVVLKYGWQGMIKILSLESISTLAYLCVCKHYSSLLVVRVASSPLTPPCPHFLIFPVGSVINWQSGIFFGFKITQYGNWTQLKDRIYPWINQGYWSISKCSSFYYDLHSCDCYAYKSLYLEKPVLLLLQ